MSVSANKAEELVRLFSKATGWRFEIMDDPEGWHLLTNEEIPKIAHARLVWSDDKDEIQIESMYLGNTTEWLEEDYDEDAAANAECPDGSDLTLIRKYLSENYPKVDKRLEAYQRIVDREALKLNVQLTIRLSGTTFFLGATIDVESLSEEEKIRAIQRNLSGLKAAFDRIMDLDKEIYEKELVEDFKRAKRAGTNRAVPS